MRSIDIADGKITGERETDDGLFGLEATLPAIVSVSEKIVDDARFPSFKGIMAAKKKPVEKLTLAGIGVESDEVGWRERRARRSCRPRRSRRRPQARRSTDEGEGGEQIADYLVAQKTRLSTQTSSAHTSRESDLEAMAEVLVLVEHAEGELKNVTGEFLTAARALGEPSAVVIGAPGTADELVDAPQGRRCGEDLRRRIRHRRATTW